MFWQLTLMGVNINSDIVCSYSVEEEGRFLYEFESCLISILYWLMYHKKCLLKIVKNVYV
jgi:hypothetical protein